MRLACLVKGGSELWTEFLFLSQSEWEHFFYFLVVEPGGGAGGV